MKIAILHQHVPDGALPDERDVLVEAEAVQAALHRLGHETAIVPVDVDLGALESRLRELGADFAFNLVETFAGTGRLHHVIPSFLEARGIPYAGNSGEALFLTSHKVLAKEWLKKHGVPVPASLDEASGPFIVKPIAEDASLGIDHGSVVPDRATAARILTEKGPGWFAEAYVEGREINAALLNGTVLQIAEVCFEGDWSGRPKIVGYAAKWDPSSFEYRHSVRRIGVDAPTTAAVSELARRCWKVLDLAGWARVDFRVSAAGDPYVLEVNGNPCLSPDAGFAASLAASDIGFDQAIDAIVKAGLMR